MSSGRRESRTAAARRSGTRIITFAGGAAATIAVAAVMRSLLDPVLGARHVFPLFLFAVVYAAWRFGIGGGFVALVLGYVAGNALFVVPHGGPSLLAADPAALDELPVYLARGVVLMVLVRALSRKDEALRRANANFESIAAGIDDVLWIIDTAKQRMVYMSPAYERVFGRSPASLMEDLRRWSDTIHPDDRALVAGEWQAAVASGRGVVEYRIVRPDGGVRWIRNRGFPTRVPGQMVGISTDITELRERTHLLKTITDTATTAIFMIDASGRVTFMNPAAEVMTGFAHGEARGRVLHELVHHARPDGSAYPVADCPIDHAHP